MKGMVLVPSASQQSLLSFSHLRYDSRVTIPSHSQISLLKTQQQRPTSAPFVSLYSSSSSSIVEGQDPLPSSRSTTVDSVGDDPKALPFSGCKSCGREQIERGCNGEGRIQGGIATFPGFGWWPIKAYRPCPGFVASGGNYRRRGQSMDEVAFGGGKQGSSIDDLGTRKKEKNRRTIQS